MLTVLAAAVPPRIAHAIARWLGLDTAAGSRRMKELSRYRYRHVWAQEELDKYWTGQNSHVSTLSHTILENLIGRIKELEEELARRSSC